MGGIIMNDTIDTKKRENYNVNTVYSNFEWDEEKNRINTRKHGVSFDEAISVFNDDKALMIADYAHSSDEERFIIIGLSEKLHVLYVCHCHRDPGDRIRIISARKASETERKIYERGLFQE